MRTNGSTTSAALHGGADVSPRSCKVARGATEERSDGVNPVAPTTNGVGFRLSDHAVFGGEVATFSPNRGHFRRFLSIGETVDVVQYQHVIEIKLNSALAGFAGGLLEAVESPNLQK